jgi:hypothetical protein
MAELEERALSRATYLISAGLALVGTGTAVFGIIQGEVKPISIGLVLICGATVFALLYLGTWRRDRADQARSTRQL